MFSTNSVSFRFIGKELSRRKDFPFLRIHIIDLETIVGQNHNLITQVDHRHHFYILMIKSQMKPLFSKKDKDIYHPGDPRRAAFEEKLRNMGRNPEELEGKTIEVDNAGVAKVSLFASHALLL